MARRWWVLILLGIVPGVVLVLWSGTPRSVDESAAGSIEASPLVVPLQAKASRAEVRRPSEAAVVPASQDLQVPVVHDLQPQFRLPPGTQLKTGTRETPWEWIAPADMETLFSYSEAKALVGGMHPATYPRFRKCGASYVPPPNIPLNSRWVGVLVLDLESSVDGYEVADATVVDATFGDPVLEACMRNAFRGTRFKAANTDPGRRYRMKWDLDFHIGMPEKQPELPPEELQSINP